MIPAERDEEAAEPQSNKLARRPGRELLVAFGVFLGLALVFTWPLVAHLGRAVPISSVDPIFTSWILAWGPEGIHRAPLHLFNAPIFFPHLLTFAITENLLGLSLPLAPVWFLTHNAALLNNVALILSLTLDGFAAYLLARELGAVRIGAGVAGFIYAFAPYRLMELEHVHVEAAFVIPLMLLVLVRHVREPSWRRGIGVGGLLAAQFWISLNSGIVAALGLGLLIVPAILTTRRGRRAFLVGSLVSGGVLALIAISPLLITLLRARRLYPWPIGEAQVRILSANLHSFLIVPKWNLFLGQATETFRVGAFTENALYPGIVAIVLASFGAWRLRRQRALLLSSLFLGVAAAIFAFGPEKQGIRLPYGWLVKLVPFFINLRVPARLWPLALLALGTLAAFALSRRSRWSFLLAGLLFIEYLSIPVPLRPTPEISPGYRFLARQSGVVFELPIPEAGNPKDEKELILNTNFMFRQTAHWLPMVNGHSLISPPDYPDFITKAGSFPSREAVGLLQSRDVRWVVIHTKELPGTRWDGLENRLSGFKIVYRDVSTIIIELPRQRA
jgi:hypothetical protein